ncbi:MAG TPA: CBS domain-containing protein [Steroidobacteraceae bacterium]|nr:CBS domain-containing protein [Steroidobacteraceae bacterium]
MNIRSLCNTEVVTARASDELSTAAALMRDRHVGYLIVADPLPLGGWSKPVGVLTDRDIVVEVLAKGVDPKSVTIGDIMTRSPVVVEETRSIDYALHEMRRIGIRRIPIVGAAGQLIGVLSIDAVVEHLAKELADVSGSIRSELRIEQNFRT